MSKPVSIILLTHDGWEGARRCLESVRRSTPAGLYELLAYDNASSDGTREGLKRLSRGWPQLRALRNERNLPFSEGVNRGMREARGRRILWLNDDTLAAPGWLEGLLEAADRRRGAVAVGPMTDHMAPPQQISSPFKTKPSGSVSEAAFLGGFCLLLDRAALGLAGFLDERFQWGWEDVDYCLRLRQAGGRLALARDVFVHHAGNQTMNKMAGAARHATDLRNRRLILRKWMRSQPWRRDLLDLLDKFPALFWEDRRPEASVVVLCRGDWKRTLACLESIRRCGGEASREVLAAALDAGAGTWRGLKELSRDWPELRILGPWKGLPPTHALNQALREARGENLAVLSERVLAVPGWLDGLIKAAGAESNIGVVGADGDAARRAKPTGSYRQVAYVADSCMLIPRRVFERVGGFDDRLTGPSAAVDYCLRTSQAGYQVAAAADAAYLEPGSRPSRRSPEESRLLFSKWSGNPVFEAELRL